MPVENQIRILIADDHAIVRKGLRDALQISGEIDVVAVAEDGEEAVRLAECVRPDLVIMDLVMPKKNGIEACREIVKLLPETRVLVLTGVDKKSEVVEAVAAGATGYVMKDTGLEELLQTVREVAEGRLCVPAQALKQALNEMRGANLFASQRALNALTEREKEILGLFARGKAYSQIAVAMGNSPATVRNSVYRIQDKLGIQTKQELVVWAVQNGLLNGEETAS